MKAIRAQIRASRILRSPREVVWSVISGGDAVERWFEWVSRTEVLDAREGGARVIHMRDGTSFDEFITINDARIQTYQYYAPAPPLPVRHVLGTKRLTSTSRGAELTWFVTFEPPPDAPPDLAETLRTLYSNALVAIDRLAQRSR